MRLTPTERRIARRALRRGSAIVFALACCLAHGNERDLTASEHIDGSDINLFYPDGPVVGYRDLKAHLISYDQDEARRTAKFQADAKAAVASGQRQGTGPVAPPAVARANAPPPGATVDAATVQTPEFQARLQRGDPAAVAAAMAYITQLRGALAGGAPPALRSAVPTPSLAQALPAGSPVGDALAMQGNPNVAVALAGVDNGNAPPFPLGYNRAWGVVKLFQYHDADHRIKTIPVGFVNVVDDNDPAYRGKIVSFDSAVASTGAGAPTPVAAAADANGPSSPPTTPARTGGAPWQPTRLPAQIGGGWIRLAYVGEPLSHRSDRLAAGAAAGRVTVSLEILDQALAANDELRASSQLDGDRQFVRSVLVTSGDQSYDFNRPNDHVEVRITTDAMRRIVSWRIRAARRTDNDNRYIRVFGPGFEHDPEIDPVTFGVGAIGSECLGSATDVVFDRDGAVTGVDGSATRLFTQSCRPGTWQLR